MKFITTSVIVRDDNKYAYLRVIFPHVWWQSLTVIASVTSLLLLVFFWHNWLILGVIIDIVLLALMATNWQPFPA